MTTRAGSEPHLCSLGRRCVRARLVRGAVDLRTSAARSWNRNGPAASQLTYFVRGQKNPRRPSPLVRVRRGRAGAGTLWLTTLFTATNEPCAPEPRLHRTGQPLRLREQRRDQGIGQVDERLDVHLRHDQHVTGEQRADVEEAERLVGLEHDVRGFCPRDDRAEQAGTGAPPYRGFVVSRPSDRPRLDRRPSTTARRGRFHGRSVIPAAARAETTTAPVAPIPWGGRDRSAPSFHAPGGALRTYVLDTSVLLADPRALVRFDEHEVVLPIVVLMELEAKRDHPELGWAARQALRALEQFRLEAGSLTEPLVANQAGGTLRVELNHQDTAGLPAALASDNNDHRILAVAKNLADEGHAVTVVTKDLPLRLKASIVGLDADEYRNELATRLELDRLRRARGRQRRHRRALRRAGHRPRSRRDLPCNTGVALVAGPSGSQSALGRVRDDKRVHLVRGDRTLFDLHGRSAEQRIAIDLLADPTVGIVSIGGPAGTGKSVIALAAGLDAVLEQRTHKRVVVFRPLYAVGGQDLGFLPGTEAEKMSPWAAAVTDALEAIVGPRSSTPCSTRACSRCCRSPTSAAAASPTPS